MPQSYQASCCFRTNVPAIATNLITNRNLPNAGSIKPCNREIDTDKFRALRAANVQLLLTILVTACSSSKDRSDFGRVLIRNLYTGIRNGLFSTYQIELGPPVSLDNNTRVQESRWIKIFYDAGDFTAKALRIEFCDGRYKRPPAHHPFPEIGYPYTGRCCDTNSCDNCF